MKTALKYALLPTATIVLWVLIVRLAIGIDPQSSLNIVGPILFNIALIAAIFLAVRTRRSDQGTLSFRQGMQTGFMVSLIYAALACIFFIIEFMVGPNLLMVEPGAETRPMWQTAAMAYAGLFFGSVVLGLVYSVIISLILRKRAD